MILRFFVLFLCRKYADLEPQIVSAQTQEDSACPSIFFACIYKAWFRYHNNYPDIRSGKFFAHPFQIMSTGPQTISEIVRTHSHICDQTTSKLEATKGSDNRGCSWWARQQRYEVLPLCRAIIVVLDQLPPLPIQGVDRKVSLDNEIERQTALLILTGKDDGLSSSVDFDGIRSRSLPLERDDKIDAVEIDAVELIRVSLKTAVHFIADLQQREERASSQLNQDTANNALRSKSDDVSAAVDYYDTYVDCVLEQPSENSTAIRYALTEIKRREEGEELSGDHPPHHWKGNWV